VIVYGYPLIIGIYVDDCLVIGKETQISQLIAELKENGFNLKIENNLKDYLSCCVIEDEKRIFNPPTPFNQQLASKVWK
jgi:hypothetical protein